MAFVLSYLEKEFKQLRNDSFLFNEGVSLLFPCACFSLFLLFWLSKITACLYSDLWTPTTLHFSSSGVPLLSTKSCWISYCIG